MSPALLDFVWTGVLFSAALALLAWCVQRGTKRPGLAHALWVLVLVKLFVPTWIGVPGVASPFAQAPESLALMDLDVLAAPPQPMVYGLDLDALPMSAAAIEAIPEPAEPFDWAALLLGIWAVGSLVVLGISSARILRFDRRLRRSTELAPLVVSNLASRIGQRLGLARMPRILLTQARLTPMVWGLGLRPAVVLPRELAEDPSRSEELHWALAHELGHVRRGDHLVRWLEWLVAVAFWWNPVAWWARRNLRINEEICCDRLVVAKLNAHPKTYANSLLNVVEFLARPELRPPAVASGINSGGAFEKRLTMILTSSNTSKTPRWMRVLSLAAAVALLPLGFAEAQEQDRARSEAQEPERRLTMAQVQRVADRLDALVAEGLITPEQARAKLEEVKGYLVVEGQELSNVEETRRRLLESEMMAKREMELAQLGERLDASVQSGLLTSAEAKEIFEKAAQRLRGEQLVVTGQKWDPRADFEKNVAQWEALVQAGRMSKAEFNEKALQMEMQLRQLEQRSEFEDYKAQLEAQHSALRADLEMAVSVGDLTSEQAKRKLQEVEVQMDRVMADFAAAQKVEQELGLNELRVGVESFDASDPRVALKTEAQALQEAYQAGLLSRIELEERQQAIRRAYEELMAAEAMEIRELDRVRSRMDQLEADQSALKEQYESNVARIKALVDAGRLSEVDAELKILELQARMEQRAAMGSELETLRRWEEDVRLDQAEAQMMDLESAMGYIKEAVKAGDLSKAEAELKMLELERALAELEVRQVEMEMRKAEMEARQRQEVELKKLKEMEQRNEMELLKEAARNSKSYFKVTASGEVMFNDREIGGAKGVERVVKRLIGKDKGNAFVVIEADPKADAAVVNGLIEAAKNGGARSVHMARKDR